MIKCAGNEIMEYVNVEISVDEVKMEYQVLGNKDPKTQVYRESGVDMWSILDIEDLVCEMLGIIGGKTEISIF